jgi:hypothetical protein
MSEMLNLPQESGEKWIVNLIRNARLDAKIDAKTVRRFAYFDRHLVLTGP